MPFIQRNPQVGNVMPLYTIGQQKTLLLVGLGNVGKEFTHTRHNIGFMSVDAFAAANELPTWTVKKDLACEFTHATIQHNRIIIMKPTTLMNHSGHAVRAVANFYRISTEQIVVVHDELDITFGTIRTRVGGSDAGHNGVKSIIEELGEAFGRIRIGIGPKQPASIDSKDFVLKKFSKEQQQHIPALTREVSAILSEYVYGSGQLNADTRVFLADII